MGSVISAPAPRTRHRFIEWLMRLAFAPVFGWKDPEHHGLEHRRIRGVDGSLLALALARSAQARPKGVVLLCHPFLKYGMSYFWRHRYHQWLTDAGYHVLAFDFKGFGNSQLAGITFADDVASAAGWVRQRYPGLPLHLFGASFGACHGIHCLSRHAGLFASAVFDSVPVSIPRFFDSGWVGMVMRGVSSSRWRRSTGTHSIVESLPSLGPLPCLFLYGGADPFVVPSEIAAVRHACSGAQVLVFEGCGHLEIRKRRRADYVGAVIGFIEAHSAGCEQPALEKQA